ncbi:MAG: hypothetical protein JW395_0805 [Nitrospira sp.]|nr:hypothetical protein [Nitrospira sp.]
MNRLIVGLLSLTAILTASCTSSVPSPPATETQHDDVAALLDQITAGPHDKVTAGDGSAELLIPNGALPAGTSVSQIRVAPLAAADVPVRSIDGSPISSYRLEPDGLSFSKPAVIRVKQSGDGTLPLVVLISKDRPELLDTSTKFDRLTKTVTISAPIAHFSEMMVARGFLGLDFPSPGNQVVGQNFSVASTVQVHTLTTTWKFREDENWVFVMEGLEMDGGWRGQTIGLTPQRVDGAPLNTSLAVGTYPTRQTFLCDEPGRKSIERRVNFRFDMYVTEGAGPKQLDFSGSFLNTEEAFDCTTAAGTPTPTPNPIEPTTMLQLPDGGIYPANQFRFSQPDECQLPHYHGTVAVGLASATSTQIVQSTDRAPRGCGFGSIQEISTLQVRLSPAQSQAIGAAILGNR